MIDSKDTDGNPMFGSKNYGIFSKMKSSKPIHLHFLGNNRLEITETGILGITLQNAFSGDDSYGNQLTVLDITSEYREDFSFSIISIINSGKL